MPSSPSNKGGPTAAPPKGCERTKLEAKQDDAGEKGKVVDETWSFAEETFGDLSSATKDALLSSDASKQLEHDFEHGIPELIAAIEIIGKMHPIVDVVVKTFTAVYHHEKTRRSNDKKIMIVFVEMKEVIYVLHCLGKINKLSGEDSSKLKTLFDLAVEEIKECGNTFDTYAKKCTFLKFTQSTSWDNRFSILIQTLRRRREEFNSFFTLISTTLMLDTNNRIKHVKEGQDEILELLKNALPPESQKYMKLYSDSKGSNEELQKMLKANPSLLSSDTEMPVTAKFTEGDLANKKVQKILEELKNNVHDIAKDEEKNREKFNQVFELQKRLIEDMKNTVVHESDRTIEEIKKTLDGPAGKIIDKDIHSIWQEGSWKGSVKALRFIIALRDYFHDETEKKATEQGSTQAVPDKWAYHYIDAPYLQSIAEAIDDDASGFIRISEVNAFTSSRPEGWSLPYWIAFWAVGWHSFAQKECAKISNIFNKMFSLLKSVKHENQRAAEEYLRCVWKEVSELTMSLDAKNHRISHSLYKKFKPYVERERRRLQASLRSLKYEIDDYGCLRAVTGPDRIEKNIFTVLRLVLNQHLKVFMTGKDKVLDTEELLGAADTIICIMGAVHTRYHDLKALFVNQRLDPKLQLRSFEHGIFKYIDDPQTLWPGGLSNCERFVVADDADSDYDELSMEKPKQELGAPADVADEEDTLDVLEDDCDLVKDSHGTEIPEMPQKEKDEACEMNLHHSVSRYHEFRCDCCSNQISTSRIICMDCVSSKGLWNSVNFCTKPDCVEKQSVHGRYDLRKAHSDQHNLLMLQRIPHVFLVLLAFYEKDEDSIYERAMKTIELTRKPVEGSKRACARCSKLVSLPCWASLPYSDGKWSRQDQISDESPVYICSECTVASESDKHDERYHVFVRCTVKRRDKDHSTEKMISRLHDRLYAVEASQDRLEEKLEILLKHLGCNLHSTSYRPSTHGHGY